MVFGFSGLAFGLIAGFLTGHPGAVTGQFAGIAKLGGCHSMEYTASHHPARSRELLARLCSHLWVQFCGISGRRIAVHAFHRHCMAYLLVCFRCCTGSVGNFQSGRHDCTNANTYFIHPHRRGHVFHAFPMLFLCLPMSFIVLFLGFLFFLFMFLRCS